MALCDKDERSASVTPGSSYLRADKPLSGMPREGSLLGNNVGCRVNMEAHDDTWALNAIDRSQNTRVPCHHHQRKARWSIA